jgi:hypothetical protein
MSTPYHPDAVVSLNTEKGKVTVYLARGGEQFPWAAHNGRVIIGPPDGTLTSDGASTDSLDWQSDHFWVIEALNDAGEAVELDPYEYGRAVKAAEAQASGRLVGEA